MILNRESEIDLSSGGYVTGAGGLALDVNHVPIGRGGSLAIQYHAAAGALVAENSSTAGPNAAPSAIPIDPATAALAPEQQREAFDDRLVFDATIQAFGFQGGGTFTLTAPNLRIADGGVLGGEHGNFTVQAISSHRVSGIMR